MCELERDRSRVFSVFRENARRELDVGAVASADGRHAWLTDADAASHDCPAQLYYPPVKFLSRPQPRLRDILWWTLPLRREAQRESRRLSPGTLQSAKPKVARTYKLLRRQRRLGALQTIVELAHVEDALVFGRAASSTQPHRRRAFRDKDHRLVRDAAVLGLN